MSEEDNTTFIAQIAESDENSMIVVAGPGAGKTTTFQKILERHDSRRNLAITFINNLANDLEGKLGASADCMTFHKFCKIQIHKNLPVGLGRDFKVYSNLPKVIEFDLSVFGLAISDIESQMRQLSITPEHLKEYIERSDYYNTIGFTDSVLRVVGLFEANPDMVPKYGIVLVDEYQDFNEQEVKLIDILSEANKILIVGDDDQALYESLKDASPRFIQEKYRDDEFTSFDLPYCGRCTRAVVESVNSIIASAQSHGLLQERVPKEFKYCEKVKGDDSDQFPSVNIVRVSVNTPKAPYLGKYILSQMEQIDQEIVDDSWNNVTPTVLVIGRGDLRQSIEKYLTEDDIPIFQPKQRAVDNPILDGLMMLLDDIKDNLGWRLTLQTLSEGQLKKIIEQTTTRPFEELIPVAIELEVKAILSILRNLKEKSDIDVLEQVKIEEFIGLDFEAIKSRLSQDTDVSTDELPTEFLGKPTVLLSSFEGAKGLSAPFVYVVGLNDGILPQNPMNISDLDVRKLIVSLTRATKECSLLYLRRIHNNWSNPSALLQWMPSDYVQQVEVDKSFFEQ